jgi:hypothetical protein
VARRAAAVATAILAGYALKGVINWVDVVSAVITPVE